jgi:hypothetical protein
LAAPKVHRVPWFLQEKIDHMFIGDASDPVKRIGTGERMPNRQAHGPARADGKSVFGASAVNL